MNKLIKAIYSYYSNSEQYKREECLCLPHDNIILTSDYPYYDKGVRYVLITDDGNITFGLDLSFLNHYSLLDLDISINYVFISNDLNLKNLVLNLTMYYVIDYIYFNIDMTSHKVINKRNKVLYLDGNVFINWLNSGLDIKLYSYRIVYNLYYKDIESLNNFYNSFNYFYSLDLDNIGVNLGLYVENSCELYSFLSNFRKILKSSYKKENSYVSFRLIVNSFDYNILDSEDDLNSLFSPLFDDYSLAFSKSRYQLTK